MRVCVCVCAPVALVMQPHMLMGKKIGMEWSESWVCRAAPCPWPPPPLGSLEAARPVPRRSLSRLPRHQEDGNRSLRQEPPGKPVCPQRGRRGVKAGAGERPARSPGTPAWQAGPSAGCGGRRGVPCRLRPLAVPRQGGGRAPGEGQGLPLTCRPPASAEGQQAAPGHSRACARRPEPVTPQAPPRVGLRLCRLTMVPPTSGPVARTK